MDVNWLEGSIRIGSTTMGRGGGVVLRLSLGDVSAPVLLHYRADDDVEHGILDVLLDESAESGIIDLGRVDSGIVRVGFAVRYNLRARYAKHECTEREGKPRSISKLEFHMSRKGAKKKGLVARVNITHRLEFKKV